MSEYLKKYFTEPSAPGPRILIDSETRALGGLAMYIPQHGELTVVSDNYTDAHINSNYFNYYFSIFGKPNYIDLIGTQQAERCQNARTMTHQYTPAVAGIAQKIGFPVDDVYAKLDDKHEFQLFVQEELGQDYSTNPALLIAGTGLHDVRLKTTELMYKGKTTLKIPLGYAGGEGVQLVNSVQEMNAFLEKVKATHEGALAKSLMIERYFYHDFSPSVTFFAGPDGVTPLTFNYQIIDACGRFIAVTNIMPKKFERFRDGTMERGLKLATQAHKIGARGFFGFDQMINTETGLEKYTECNYRGTAATNPVLNFLKATRFTRGIDEANWVFIPCLPYTNDSPDIINVASKLQEWGSLFEGDSDRTSIETPRATVLYGALPQMPRMPQGGYCLSYFWEKNKTPHNQAFNTINKDLGKLQTGIQLLIKQD